MADNVETVVHLSGRARRFDLETSSLLYFFLVTVMRAESVVQDAVLKYCTRLCGQTLISNKGKMMMVDLANLESCSSSQKRKVKLKVKGSLGYESD